MEAIQLTDFQTQAERFIATRSGMYSLTAELFRYPDEMFRNQARDKSIETAIESLFKGLPYSMDWPERDRKALRVLEGVSDDDIEVEFIRLFEAGPGSPPCPLVEGLFRDDRKAILKELILFYNNFGLSYAEGSMEDRPDHICYQMEFMHFLSFKELHAIKGGKDAVPYLMAQRDFLRRHPLKWIGKLLDKMNQIAENPPDSDVACLPVFVFYQALIRVSLQFLVTDCDYLEALLAG
jgi:DMSO reductase family type II enzyme chaperone